MKFFDFIRNHSGVGTTEAIIGVGLLGLVTLGGVKLSEQYNKSTRLNDIDEQIIAASERVALVMRSKDACERSFVGLSIGDNNGVTAIKDKSNNDVISSTTMTDIAGNDLTGKVEFLKAVVHDYNALRKDAIVDLYYRRKDQVGKTNDMIKSFIQKFEIDGSNAITSCISSQDQYTKGLIENICANLNYAPVAGDTPEQQCQKAIATSLTEIEKRLCTQLTGAATCTKFYTGNRSGNCPAQQMFVGYKYVLGTSGLVEKVCRAKP